MLDSAAAHFAWAAGLAKIGWVDVVALILILWGMGNGIRKGLEVELPKFIEVSVATLIILHYYRVLGGIFQNQLSAPRYPAEIVSFFLIALSCFVTLRLLAKIAGAVITVKYVSPVSRAGGALAGTLRFILFFSLLSYFLVMIPLNFFANSYSFERSWSGPFFVETSEKFYRLVTYYIPVKLPAPTETRAGQEAG